MPRQTEQERADFDAALNAVRAESSLTRASLVGLSHLEGPDLDTFRGAWESLTAPARERLVRRLHRAATELPRLDFSAVNHLALRDPDASVRLAGVQSALEDASPDLMHRLASLAEHDPSSDVRAAAAEDLGRFALMAELEALAPEQAREVRVLLFRLLDDPEATPGVRSAALAALGYFSDGAAAERVDAGFADASLRLAAIRAMGHSADPRWTERLISMLEDEDAEVRLEAASALGEIEDERAIEPLSDLVDDQDSGVRLAAIEALGEIGGDGAREVLVYVLQDPSDRIREAAEAAIATIDAADDPLSL